MTYSFTADNAALESYIDNKEQLTRTAKKELKKLILPLINEWELRFTKNEITNPNDQRIQDRLTTDLESLVNSIILRREYYTAPVIRKAMHTQISQLQNEYCYSSEEEFGGLELDQEKHPSQVLYKNVPLELEDTSDLAVILSTNLREIASKALKTTFSDHPDYSLKTGKVLLAHITEVILKQIPRLQGIGINEDELTDVQEGDIVQISQATANKYRRALVDLPEQLKALTHIKPGASYYSPTKTQANKKLATLIVSILCDIAADLPVDLKLLDLIGMRGETSMEPDYFETLLKLIETIASQQERGEKYPKLDTTMNPALARDIKKEQTIGNPEFAIFAEPIAKDYHCELRTLPRSRDEVDFCAKTISNKIFEKYNIGDVFGLNNINDINLYKLLIQQGITRLLKAPFDLQNARAVDETRKLGLAHNISQLPEIFDELLASNTPTDANTLLIVLTSIGLNKPVHEIRDLAEQLITSCTSQEQIHHLATPSTPSTTLQDFGNFLDSFTRDDRFQGYDKTVNPVLEKQIKEAIKRRGPETTVMGETSIAINRHEITATH